MKNYIILIVFTALLTISLSTKVMNIMDYKPIEENRISPIAYLLNQDFVQIEQFNILNNDFMITSVLTHDACNAGNLYVTPLFRNSEGVSAIEQNIVKQGDQLFFIYKGKLYKSFPSLQFWVGTHLEKMINIFTKSTSFSSVNYVLSVVEKGRCNFKNTVSW